MFAEFFAAREWATWAWAGIAIIAAGTYGMVHLDVWINEWFGEFYNVLQKALAEKDAVTPAEFNSYIFQFARIAAFYVLAAVLLSFFTKHWTFRWRTAMNDYYMTHWPRLRKTEGASQRVQEDTKLFAKLMEDLGSTFLESILTFDRDGVNDTVIGFSVIFLSVKLRICGEFVTSSRRILGGPRMREDG